MLAVKLTNFNFSVSFLDVSCFVFCDNSFFFSQPQINLKEPFSRLSQVEVDLQQKQEEAKKCDASGTTKKE